ncbi:23S rRNA (guanosine(2251)-2'-O)-methyltransferase RlmB [Anaerorhabdus sp.]|uniref:23S rRNA (guanosine(2251)-2'-O)-methyltransferase RlmB n=1 Tax=Anaerorhabdus sp. TaxID=1872524 RepID=UPI002FCAB090
MAQYIYGKNMVQQLLKDNKKIDVLYVLDNQKDIEQAGRKKGIRIERVDRKHLDKLAEGGNHQGVIAKVEEYKTVSIDQILSTIPEDKLGFLVMLDELEDPHNLGAILRTADAVGVDGIIIKKNNAVGLTSTVAKVSAGAIETVPVADVTNLTQTLKQLKDKGYWVVGTDMKNAQDYRQPKYDTPIVLVIGNEGKGISRLVKEECDFLVKLPMVGEISSLNASVACGILMYEVYNKRFPL